MDLLKKTHKNSESTYIKQDVFKAMFFNNEQLDAGTSNRKKTPIKGNSNIKTSKLATVEGKKSDINTLQDLNLCLAAQKAAALSN